MGNIKINCDASIFGAENKHGFGWIARGHRGILVEAEAAVGEGQVEVHLAEAYGIKEVLSWIYSDAAAFEHRAVPQTDCLVAVHAIASSTAMLSPFGLIIKDCKRFLELLPNVSVSFVKRSGNKAANWLARSACSNPGRILAGDVIPVDLLTIMYADLS